MTISWDQIFTYATGTTSKGEAALTEKDFLNAIHSMAGVSQPNPKAQPYTAADEQKLLATLNDLPPVLRDALEARAYGNIAPCMKWPAKKVDAAIDGQINLTEMRHLCPGNKGATCALDLEDAFEVLFDTYSGPSISIFCYGYYISRDQIDRVE